QAFVVCPRIEPSEEEPVATRGEARKKFELKSVKEEYEKLSKTIFPDLNVAMLHGQMRPKEKEKIMNDFHSGKTQVLVSTSVIEVGVDVPNAGIMMIEGSDRFGLAQLYQLRGRIGRGEHESFCFLLTDSESADTHARLKAIIEAKNGFELAEHDLELRGPGQFLGDEQTGFPDLAMKSLQNVELVKSSREAAAKILTHDRNLSTHPLLKEKLLEFEKKVHLE
ncbi:MAG: helicase-related protein, partial [Candidatus Liptonbacteria bacterium]|nr:helicase-related protein [Candidatus Liptonbacteria bacterium]